MERALAIVPILVSIPYLISLGQGPKWEFIPMWDDVGNFIENDMIRDLGVSNLAAMWTEVRINVYEPLSWILKAFTVKMFGMSSFFVRLVTVCIHAANTTLVYSLTRRLVPSSCPTSSMVTALLWGLHPVQTEVICWPSAQPYALASFFALLSVKSYVDNDKYGEYASTTPEFSSTLKTLIRRWTLERPHFYVCSALIALTMWANHHGMQLDADTYTLTQQERIGRIILSYSHSFLRVLWPVDLRPHYRLKIRDVQLDSSHVILASTVFLIFVLYSIVKWRKRRVVIATAVLCAATLAPVSVPVMTAWLNSSRLRIALACIVAFAFATLSLRQCEVWRNPNSFFDTSLSIDEADWRILDIKSEFLLKQDLQEEAFKLMDITIAHSPKYGIKAQMNIAKFHILRNEVQLACQAYVNAYNSVVISAGGQATGALHNNLGVCALYVDAFQDAYYHFEKGLEIGAVLPRHMEILEMNLVEFRKWDGVSQYRGGHQLIF